MGTATGFVAKLGRLRHRRLPLHVQIALAFSLLTLALGAALISFQVRQMAHLALNAAHKEYARIAYRVDAEMGRTLTPIQAALELLDYRQSQHRIAELARKSGNLSAVRDALQQSSALASLFVAADSGEHFVARLLRPDSALAQRIKAPPGASLQVLSVEPDAAGRLQRHMLFYSDTLDLLEERREAGESGQGVRNQDWYRRALNEGGQSVITPMYVFPYSGEIGATFARRVPSGAVIGADISLQKVSVLFDQVGLTESSRLYLLDADGRILAERSLLLQPERPAVALLQPAQISSPMLAELAHRIGQPAQPAAMLRQGGRNWLTQLTSLLGPGGSPLYLALLAPEDELLREVGETRQYAILIAVLLVVLALPLVWWAARRVARPLEVLTAQVDAIRSFRFEENGILRSGVREIDQLAASMASMKATIRRFLEIGAALAGEREFSTLLAHILRDSAGVVGARGGVIYLLDEDGPALRPAGTLWHGKPLAQDWPAASETDHPAQRALSGPPRVQHLDAPALARWFAGLPDVRELNAIGIGLRNRQGDAVGVLLLLMPIRAQTPPELLALLEALSGSAAIAIESQRLLAEQKRLLDSVIELVAAAIDAKSPYTGAHCQRVPVLARLLAEAANAADDGPFCSFLLAPEDREALHIASWLHDCGKVTTPEYVVDKATRLETLYDRIHEIRMRFELLKSEAARASWQAIADGAARSESLAGLHATQTRLDEEFAFVAACNAGETEMTPERVERLQQIARRNWTRTLDDRLGLSREALARKGGEAGVLPVPEPLLADRPEHRIAHDADCGAPHVPGIRLQAPAWRYDHGELHNLSILRGTLTAEERYKINEHIIQTIAMLSRLELPRHLRRVPEIAGGHHERIDGTGYPQGLRGEQMSVLAKIMAIADVFEALTAGDRPYKPAKKLSEALAIMADMVTDGHLDAELFKLFLDTGVWRRYARDYMPAEQNDVPAEA